MAIMIKNRVKDLVDKFIRQEDKLNTLPPLSELERAQFEHSIDIEHLYFSSKIEGSNLTKKQIDQAVHGSEI
jgi:Fic family protein